MTCSKPNHLDIKYHIVTFPPGPFHLEPQGTGALHSTAVNYLVFLKNGRPRGVFEDVLACLDAMNIYG